MHLLPADGREPFQKLVYRRALVEVLEQCSDRQAGTAKAPCPAELPRVSIDGATAAPVHAASLAFIGDPD